MIVNFRKQRVKSKVLLLSSVFRDVCKFVINSVVKAGHSNSNNDKNGKNMNKINTNTQKNIHDNLNNMSYSSKK